MYTAKHVKFCADIDHKCPHEFYIKKNEYLKFQTWQHETFRLYLEILM
jgi:hypothetical protein